MRCNATQAPGRSLIEFALKRFETIDMLVLNAGVACHQPFEETDLATFQSLMQVNYFGAWRAVRGGGSERNER